MDSADRLLSLFVASNLIEFRLDGVSGQLLKISAVSDRRLLFHTVVAAIGFVEFVQGKEVPVLVVEPDANPRFGTKPCRETSRKGFDKVGVPNPVLQLVVWCREWATAPHPAIIRPTPSLLLNPLIVKEHPAQGGMVL